MHMTESTHRESKESCTALLGFYKCDTESRSVLLKPNVIHITKNNIRNLKKATSELILTQYCAV